MDDARIFDCRSGIFGRLGSLIRRYGIGARMGDWRMPRCDDKALEENEPRHDTIVYRSRTKVSSSM
jgi:hypothetical protein